MKEYELELEEISHSLKEIVVEMKEANRLLGGICSVADKSLAQPAIDPNEPIHGNFGAVGRIRFLLLILLLRSSISSPHSML